MNKNHRFGLLLCMLGLSGVILNEVTKVTSFLGSFSVIVVILGMAMFLHEPKKQEEQGK